MSPKGHLRVTGFLAIAMTALFAGLVAGARGAPTSLYTVVDLGTLGGSTSKAFAVSDLGQVVGWSYTSESRQHAFSWTPATGMVDLGTLGGDFSYATGVNVSGQVVGCSATTTGISHAFLWTGALGITDLGSLGGPSCAVAISAQGDVIGDSLTASGAQHAFIWTRTSGMVDLGSLSGDSSYPHSVNVLGQVVGGSGGHAFLWTQSPGMSDLGVLPGGRSSEAMAINDSGQVTGNGYGSDWRWHAFVWSRASGMRDLGTLGGDTYGFGIDLRGEVYGESYVRGDRRGFLWTESGGLLDLGTLGGSWCDPTDMSATGVIVGVSPTSQNEFHAFAWTPARGMLDLGAAGGYMSEARAVNASGQVAGSAYPIGGYEHAVLWQPSDTTPPVLGVSVTPNVIWPPSHKYVTVRATVTATDDSGIDPTVELVSVVSSEPDNAPGDLDGNTTNDIVRLDDYTFNLRAERNERSAGRHYTITYKATDTSGNSATQSATVTVPLEW